MTKYTIDLELLNKQIKLLSNYQEKTCDVYCDLKDGKEIYIEKVG